MGEEGVRGLPSATEQEADVLGTCLAEGLSWWRAVERVAGEGTPELFWDGNLRLVASAMAEISASSGTLTVASLTDQLQGNPAAESLVPDITTFLVQLQTRSTIRSLADLTGTINTLHEKRQLRNQIRSLDRLRTTALKEELHPNEVAAQLRQISLDGAVNHEVLRFGEIIQRLEDEDSIGVPWRLPTGVKALDAIIRGGYEPGRLYVFGARPKVGKTTVVLNSVLEALASDAIVLFVSLEISDRELWSKALSAQAWVEQSRIQDMLDGKISIQEFTPEEQSDIKEAKRELKAAKLYTLFGPDIRNGVESVLAAAISVKGKYPENTPFIIFIDYIQLLVQGTSFNRTQEIGDISRRLKLFAQEMNAAIVTPSQVNRAGAEEGMPSPHMLRESGNLEQDADVVVLMNRPALQDETEPAHIMDMWVSLNRVGPPGWVKAFYAPEFQTVRDLEEEGWSGGDSDRRDSQRESPPLAAVVGRGEAEMESEEYD